MIMEEQKQNIPSSLEELEQDTAVRHLLTRIQCSFEETDSRFSLPSVEDVWNRYAKRKKPDRHISPWWLVAALFIGFVLGIVCRLDVSVSSESMLVCADTVRQDSSQSGRLEKMSKKQAEPLSEKPLTVQVPSENQKQEQTSSYQIPAPQCTAFTSEIVTGQIAVQNTAEDMDWSLLVSGY